MSAKFPGFGASDDIVAAVRGGLLTPEEACSRYMLTAGELLAWQYLIDHYGFSGLRTTRIQKYPGKGRPRTRPPIIGHMRHPYATSFSWRLS